MKYLNKKLLAGHLFATYDALPIDAVNIICERKNVKNREDRLNC